MKPEAKRYDLLVVGAGPAGMHAALLADEAGLRVAVVDEQAAAGGQIFRQPPASFAAPESSAFASYPFGRELLAKAKAAQRIDWYFATSAWGAFTDVQDGIRLAINAADGAGVLRARKLLIATGAYDLPVPFPGWTLPGVMSAGGVQTLLKSQFLRSAQRYVLVGSHPLQLLLASQLLDAGAHIAEVAIARPRPRLGELMAGCKALPGNVRLFAQLGGILFKLWRHRVPVRFSTLITQASGTEGVEQVTLSQADDEWQVLPGTERTHQVDGLAVGYGLLASTELARQAGCAVSWKPQRGGWVVKHDAHMRTSNPDIYVAGEPASVAGAQAAYCQGRVAGLAVIRALKPEAADSAREQAAHQALEKTKPFADTVARFFAPRLDALARLADTTTLICRCEDVSVGQVKGFLQAHPHVSSVNSVKLACRSGMGPCQGRYCQHTVAHLVADSRGIPVANTGAYTAQAPVKPVPLAHLAVLQLED